MTSSDYLERLRAIRNKYGCSNNYQDTSYIREKAHEPSLFKLTPVSFDGDLDRKRADTGLPSNRALDHWRRDGVGYLDREEPYSHKKTDVTENWKHGYNDHGLSDRQREIQKIRKAFEESRKQVYDDHVGKHNHLDHARDDYHHGMTSSHRNELSSARPRSSYMEHSYYNAESVSPIKRVRDLSEIKPSREQDAYWREREAKLSELASNRMRQHRYEELSSKPVCRTASSTKLSSTKISSIREGENRKPVSMISGANMKEYSVSNISKIQERIHSILGRQ